jgi:tetratricopeptide (TPR) repeat protein
VKGKKVSTAHAKALKITKKHKENNELSIRWKRLDIINKFIIGFAGIIIAYQQINIQKMISNTTQDMENQRAKFSNNIAQGQLVSSLINTLIKGSKKEKLIALDIIKQTGSDTLFSEQINRFLESIAGTVALSDPEQKVRIEAINALEERGKSTFTKQILQHIQKQGSTVKEREAAIQAQEQIEKRIKTELDRGLNLARILKANNLFQSAAEEFQKFEDLLTGPNVDQKELELARVAFSVKDYESAVQHYIKATEGISQ